MPPLRSDIVAAGRSWLGTPFRHCGRSEREIDCFGHLVLVSRSLGLRVHDTPKRPYSTHVSDLYDRYLRRAMCPVPLEAALPGDWLLLGRLGQEFGTHTALLTGDGTIVHACPVALSVIEVSLDAALADKVKTGLVYRELSSV